MGLRKNYANIREIKRQMARTDEVYKNASYAVITRVEMSPGWHEKFQRMEKEVLDLGFYHSHFYHNASFSAEGMPNFTSVYLRPDGHVQLTLYFSLWSNEPGLKIVDESRATERIHTTCTSIYPGPAWLVTSEGMGTIPWPESVTVFDHPKDTSIARLYEYHLENMASPPWTARQPLAVLNVQTFMEMQKQQHKVLNDTREKRKRLT